MEEWCVEGEIFFINKITGLTFQKGRLSGADKTTKTTSTTTEKNYKPKVISMEIKLPFEVEKEPVWSEIKIVSMPSRRLSMLRFLSSAHNKRISTKSIKETASISKHMRLSSETP